MDSHEIRKRFLDFFAKRGHKIVPSSSLIPDDPSVLLTTAGMQQFKPYYTGAADPLNAIHPSLGTPLGSKNAASIQKSFRTSDIDEVGDESHLTFFEMLGNFSFGYKPGEPVSPKGGYFKEEAIKLAHEFIASELGLKIDYVSVFGGEGEVPADTESEKIWKGIEPGIEVKRFGRADNFWGPTGKEGPCGPTTEIYLNGVEIWNIVFNEYYQKPDETLEKLKTPGVDTGMGLERLAMVLQKKKNIFETDLFAPLMELLPAGIEMRHKRIIADHLRGSTFLLADGVRPSNKERGYILRRLMRRAMIYENTYKITMHVFDAILHDIVHEYGRFYPELLNQNETIRKELQSERELLKVVSDVTTEGVTKILIEKAKNQEDRQRLIQLLTELRKEKRAKLSLDEPSNFAKGFKPIPYMDLREVYTISGKEAFDLYQSTGASLELITQLAKRYFDFTVDEDGFWKEFRKHQEISRAGLEKKFGGHGLILDTGELKAADEAELKKVTRLHTATHLLNAALHKVLGDAVEQRGSDITVERTRFDFLFPRKLTSEEIKEIEDLVNYAVAKNFSVTIKEMPVEEAKKSGALYFYKGNYPPTVKVYTIGDENEVFSRELCGGPHVARTGEIGKFKILKEESSSAGVRRIRAVIEP